MSIEPKCDYCTLVCKFRCKTEEQAVLCGNYNGHVITRVPVAGDPKEWERSANEDKWAQDAVERTHARRQFNA